MQALTVIQEMARFSDSEVELLVRGANAVAQMQQLGIPREEIEGLIAGGAQTMQARNNRRAQSGSFKFSPPFMPGKTELRPVAERTGPQEGRQAGATIDRPEITEAYVQEVVKRIRAADEGLKGQDLNNNDFGQRTINKGIKELGSSGERELESAGFEALPEDEQGGGRAYDDDPSFTEYKQQKAEDYQKEREYQLGRMPRFENPRDMGSGGDQKTPYYPLSRDEGVSSRAGQGSVNRGAAADTLQRLQQAISSGAVSATPQTDRIMRELGVTADPRLEIQAQRAAAQQVIDENPTNVAGAARNRSDFLSEVESERGRRRRGIFPEGRRGNDQAALTNLDNAYMVPDPVVRDTSLVDDKGQPNYVTMDTVVAGSNTPDTSNNLNAPKAQSATEFVAQQTDATGSAGMFGNNYVPDVAIGTSLGRLDQAIADLGGREMKVGQGRLKRSITPFSREMIQGIGPIRSIDGLQKAADAILAVGQEAGVNFRQMVFTEGRMKAEQVGNPGVGEVLQFLKMNAGEQQRLGIALNNVDLAGQQYLPGEVTPIGMEAKRRFRAGEPGTPRPDVNFGVANLPGRSKGLEPEAGVARMPADKAKRVKANIRGPEGVGAASQDAMMPWIGAVAGEETPVSYIRGVAPNAGYEDAGVSAIDDEVRGRVFVGGPDERSVRDAAIRRIVDRGTQDQARRDEIASGMMRMDRRPGRMF